MRCLTLVLVTALLCTGFSASMPDYPSDSNLPGNTGLRPVIVKQTQFAGYAEERGGRVLTTATKIKPSRTCSCPRSDGWTPEQLDNYKKKINLIGEIYDCFCYGPDGYFLKQRFLDYKK